MFAYDVICPTCGHRNTDLYLDDSNGWMECEKCQTLHEIPQFRKGIKIPVFRPDNLPKEILRAKTAHPVTA